MLPPLKKVLWIVLPLLGLLAWWGWRWAEGRAAAEAVPMVWKGEAPQRAMTDGAEVFRRAFWRQAGAGDKIVHAERYEWSDEGGLTKMQWFLEVKPSPELLKYLRDDNAFGLAKTGAASLPEERPSWFAFKAEEVEVWHAPQGKMQLIFRARDQTLFATDLGRGFQRGAPEPLPKAVAPGPAGRLPTTPPPQPKP